VEGAPWESDLAESDLFPSWSEAVLMLFRVVVLVLGSKSRVRARMRERAYAPSYFSPISPVKKGKKRSVGTPSWERFPTGHPQDSSWKLEPPSSSRPPSRALKKAPGLAPERIPPQYNISSTLTAEVEAGTPNTFEFRLAETADSPKRPHRGGTEGWK
jgi:hypothetical protein